MSIYGSDIQPAQIGSSTYAFPADPTGYFYYTLGMQKLEKSITLFFENAESDAERLLMNANNHQDNNDMHFGDNPNALDVQFPGFVNR